MNRTLRIALLALYAALVLPCLFLLLPVVPGWLFRLGLLLNATGLVAAKCLQDILYAGPMGMGAPMCLFVTPLQWWPLPALAIFPQVWVDRRWRVATTGWLALAAALSIVSVLLLLLRVVTLAG